MNKIISAALTFVALGCFNYKETEKQLVGKWIGQDKAVLYLKPDSTFSINNLPAKVVNATYSNNKFDVNQINKLTYSGYWSVDKYTSNDGFELHTVTDGKGKEIHPSLYFIIHRSGFFRTGPPERLQIYLDSDGVDVYEFRRDFKK